MSKAERVGRRIPSEEMLLQWLANEKPEHRVRLLEAVEPYLKFKLSPGFDRGKLAGMAHIPLGEDVSPAMAGKA